MSGRRLKLGDVVEISTRDGFVYMQYTHRHKQYGYLVRVFVGEYGARPVDFDDVTSSEVRFPALLPLQTLVNKGIFEVVGNEQVRLDLAEFPMFRAGIPSPSSKRVENWWLWDGECEYPLGELTDEQKCLPIRGIWNDTMLIRRIEENWRPEAAAN